MNFWLIYSVLLDVALIDIAIKEGLIKGWLLPKLNNDWSKVPNFWKDLIPGGKWCNKWYRIRWSYVLNGAGVIFTWYWLGLPSAVAYWWLTFCNAESIFYQWFKKLVHLKNDTVKWFDLQDDEEWMKCLPFNRWVGKYLHSQGIRLIKLEDVFIDEEDKLKMSNNTYYSVNPEVIYLVWIWGNIVLFAVNELLKGV